MNDERPATKGDLTAMGAATKADFVAVNAEFAVVRAETKAEFAAVRGDIKEIKMMLRPMIVTLSNHSAELADIRTHIHAKLPTREEFHARMDAFTGRVEDFDYASAKNRARLDDHEQRISDLEGKRT